MTVFIISLLLVGCVSVFAFSNSDVKWSNPSVGFPEPHTEPIKENCIREEWNNNFDKFRAGEISKKDMKKYIGGCKW